MKIKCDFVTNSSSTGYIISIWKNKITAREFVEELWELGLQECMKKYEFNYTKEELIKSLQDDYDIFPIKRNDRGIVGRSRTPIGIVVSFGDEHGTIAGRVFDYCLRNGYDIPNKFEVKYYESFR